MADPRTAAPDSDLDPTDPYAREAQIYPRLSEEMARRIAAYGQAEAVPTGTLVFERGQRSVDFFFVLAGKIEIFDLDSQGTPIAITVHRERQFTGELDLFNDRAILVSGRAVEEAHLAIVRNVSGLNGAEQPYQLQLEDGQAIRARAVVVATGARYRKLDVPGYEKYEGQGIHYAATAMEQKLCGGEEVIVVGGGNSAGQAAVFLARTSAHLHLLVRADGLAATMSDYLVQRIVQNKRITLHPRTEIRALAGDDRLRSVTWINRATGASETRAIGNVFLMIGAEPNTEWLKGFLPLDAKRFIKTGAGEHGAALGSPYATSKPGLFAIGDVRSGSVKRVASSVGEGSVVIQAVHQFLNPDPA